MPQGQVGLSEKRRARLYYGKALPRDRGKTGTYHDDAIDRRSTPMSTTVHYPHLRIDADGTARIDGSRYRVIHLAGEHYHYGWSAEEVLRQHPDLRPEQVYAAVRYLFEQHERLVLLMLDTATSWYLSAAQLPISRAVLLKEGYTLNVVEPRLGHGATFEIRRVTEESETDEDGAE